MPSAVRAVFAMAIWACSHDKHHRLLNMHACVQTMSERMGMPVFATAIWACSHDRRHHLMNMYDFYAEKVTKDGDACVCHGRLGLQP